uniref:Uncharacterized protein n=1 Tax=Anguilla anguilla TaxID=7936 RepID=A0A0E9T3K3_ANGAN
MSSNNDKMLMDKLTAVTRACFSIFQSLELYLRAVSREEQ